MFKQALRNELKKLNLGDLNSSMWYFNDLLCGTKTLRRIKAEVDRPLSEYELGTLAAALGNVFDAKVDVKNYTYCRAPFVIVYIRNPEHKLYRRTA